MVHSSREEPGTEPGFLLSFSIFCNTASLSAVSRPAAAASPWNWWKCMSWSHLLNQELRNQTAISICDLRRSPGGGHLFNHVAQMVKKLPAMQETRVRSLGREDTLEKERATHSNILAWETPQTEVPGGLQPMGSQRVGHD